MKTEHIQVKPSDEHTNFLLVEAIYDGFHVRKYRSGLDIISEHTEEDKEFIRAQLSRAFPFPIYDLNEWSKRLVKLIEETPNSRVIQSNSFEYVDGAYPDGY